MQWHPGRVATAHFRSACFFKSRFASPPSLRFGDIAYLRAAFGGGESRRPPPPRSPRRPQGNEVEFSNLNDDAPDMSRAEEGLTICYYDRHPITQKKWCMHRVFGCIFSYFPRPFSSSWNAVSDSPPVPRPHLFFLGLHLGGRSGSAASMSGLHGFLSIIKHVKH